MDWDLDGDLDLWLSNRTGPRLTFLKNDFQPAGHFLAVRLVGASSNRDAIGARVELFNRDSPHRSIRTLRAGEGYLSQSSKWIHFGLGGERHPGSGSTEKGGPEGGPVIDRVVVRWPGGAAEEFRGLLADRRYELVEGTGTARAWTAPQRTTRLAASEPAASEPDRAPGSGSVRVVPHARLPLPRLEYLDLGGKVASIGPSPGRTVLAALWATWCPPCLEELGELAENRERLRAAGLEILPLSVDDLDADWAARKSKVEPVLAGLKVPWRGGLATPALVARLDAVQRTLLSKKTSLPVPSSFLIDPEGRLAAVYKGKVPARRLLEDAADSVRKGREDRDAALPFPGRWFVNPFGADLLAIPRELLAISHAGEALDYLTRHVASDPAGFPAARAASAALTTGALAETYLDVGVALARERKGGPAASAFRKAVALNPQLWVAQAALAEALRGEGDLAGALAQYRRMLELRPGDGAAANNLAWILATRPEATGEDIQEAVRHAGRLCEATRYQVPWALDTLAATYAAGGRFGEAVAAAEKAIGLASAAGQEELAERIRGRLALYRANRPYREGAGGTAK